MNTQGRRCGRDEQTGSGTNPATFNEINMAMSIDKMYIYMYALSYTSKDIMYDEEVQQLGWTRPLLVMHTPGVPEPSHAHSLPHDQDRCNIRSCANIYCQLVVAPMLPPEAGSRKLLATILPLACLAPLTSETSTLLKLASVQTGLLFHELPVLVALLSDVWPDWAVVLELRAAMLFWNVALAAEVWKPTAPLL